MTVSRDEVFGVLQGIVPRLEEALPGWSVRPNITGTGAVGLYLDGPNLPLAGVNVMVSRSRGTCAVRFRPLTAACRRSWGRCVTSTSWV